MKRLLLLAALVALAAASPMPPKASDDEDADAGAKNSADGVVFPKEVEAPLDDLEDQIAMEDENVAKIAAVRPPPGIIDPILPPPPPKTKNECEHQELSGDSGLFSSPNFPNSPEGKTNCTWNITVPEGNSVRVTFHLVNIGRNHECRQDRITLRESDGEVIKSFCGTIHSDLVATSKSNVVHMRAFTNYWSENRGFLASWQAVPEGEEEEVVVETDEGQERSYLLTYPESFAVSEEVRPEEVCLQLDGVSGGGTVTLELWNRMEDLLEGQEPTLTEEFQVESGGEAFKCQRIKLEKGSFEPGLAMMRVKGEFGEDDYKFLAYRPVRVIDFEPSLLVQTDKGDYQPGQLVRFRMMALDVELTPAETVQELDEVWLTNPGGSRLAQWRDVKLDKGMAQLEYQLPEEPIQGYWQIHVRAKDGGKEEVVGFSVSERVLPKFEVTVDGPKVVLRDSDSETFRICGVYTHGGKLNGKLNATFTSTVYSHRWNADPDVTEVSKPIVQLEEGCGEVTLDAAELERLTNKTSNFKLLAIVTEGVTNVRENVTRHYYTSDLPFTIQRGQTTYRHVLGGFPVVQEVRVASHDGEGIEGANLEVCARLFTDVQVMRNKMNQLRYSADEDQLLQLSETLKGLLFEQTCVDAVSGPDGRLRIAVPIYEVPENVTKLSLKVVASDHPDDEETGMTQPSIKVDVELERQEHSSAIAIPQEENPKLSCGENRVRVYLSAKTGSQVTMSHVVNSGNIIVRAASEKVTVSGPDVVDEYVGDALVIDSFTLAGRERPEGVVLTTYELDLARPLENEGDLYQRVQLLIVSEDEDGSYLSETARFQVESCAPKPTATFSQESAHPGDKLRLKIQSHPDSMCGYGIVDKALDLLPNPNKVTVPRVQGLKESLSYQRRFYNSYDRYVNCYAGGKRVEEKGGRVEMVNAIKRLDLVALSDHAGECFNINDITAIVDDLKDYEDSFIGIRAQAAPVAFAAARPAPPGAPPRPEPALAAEADFDSDAGFSNQKVATATSGGSVEENKVDVRDYFPETWLFDMVELDGQGDAEFEVEAPHTITTWLADVVCTHSEVGVGVSDRSSLLVTQDFFADILMPYSVKRGEILPVNVSIFNTVDRSLPIRLTVAESEAYKLDRDSHDVCVPETDNDIKTFMVKAKELHEVNVTVEARITDEAAAAGDCQPAGDAEGYTDTIRKSIQVKPEGFPVEKVESKFHCLEGAGENEEIPMEALNLPAEEELVEDSQRAWVMVTGDIMAPSLNNLDRLVRMPTGCGEQNMIGMAPNVYLLDYLEGTGQSKPELESKAKSHILKGYEREQEFRHDNGAYSVWGQQDKVGSMWLTSFVVKVFGQSSRFVNIPQHNVQESVKFILDNQLKDGCFRNVGYVLHSDLRGTEYSITPSALVTLLEVNRLVKVKPEVIRGALECIRSNSTDELYTKAVTAYALSLYNEMRGEISQELEEAPEAATLVEELLESANKTRPGQLFWWDDQANYRSRAVEITAYAVLSLSLQDRLPDALRAIKWLTTQRNAYGGFYSTQDTMVALQAISQYSLRVSGVDKDLTVNILEDETGEAHEFSIDEENKLLLQREKVTALPSAVGVSAAGRGCFMVQTVLRYNVKTSPDRRSFALRAELAPDQQELVMCAAYTGSDESTTMVVLEAELLTGYRAETQALDALRKDEKVKKVEYDDKEGKVVVYFESLPREEHCVEVGVVKAMDVEELKPAVVKVYDYYKTEDVVSEEYSEPAKEE